VRDEQLEQPPLETGVVLVGMSVMLVVVVVVVVAMLVIVRIVVIVVAVGRLPGHAHAVACSARWCAGVPPRACSA